jgi:hypothetical protein
MGFVLAYGHDIFLSYAHINDLPWEGNPGTGPATGWVTRFIRHLGERVTKKIGRPEYPNFYFDNSSLRSNHNLTEEIAAHLKTSAVFVAIESPGYLASIWCQDEARLFTQHFKHDLSARVFVVRKEPLDQDSETLPELSGRRNIEFWYIDPNKKEKLLDWPMSVQDEILYKDKVYALADDIYTQLRAMGGRLPPSPERPLTGGSSNGSDHDERSDPRPRPLVFLNTELTHQMMAEEIRKGIGERAVWIDPLFTGPAGEVREDLEQNMIDCDAMVLVYASNASWARTQLRLLRKLEPRRNRRPVTIPIIDVPAPNKSPLGIHGLQTVMIDGGAGIKPETLKTLSDCLHL